MGCPSEVEIGDNLVFSITTHDPDTGVLTDADAVPSYRVYEDETGTAILTGNMAKLDDANTTGFYTETITCSAANGFENGKTYSVYIEATVDGDTGGICYGFKAETAISTVINAQVCDVLKTDTVSEMAQGAPPATPTIEEILNYLYRKLRNKTETTAAEDAIYDDAGSTKLYKAVLSYNGTTLTKSEYESGA